MDLQEDVDTEQKSDVSASTRRLSIQEFAVRLARLGLVDAAGLHRAVEEFPKARRDDLATLLELLFEKGLITPWQAEQITAHETPLLNVGGYRLLAKLGEGLRGAVYLARYPQRDQVVALKVLRVRQLADDEGVKARLQKTRSYCRLEHPNIVTTYDVGIDRGRVFQAMEFLGGQDLGSRIVLNGRMSITDALGTVTKIAAGVEYLHQQRLVHGSLKPRNVMVTADGSIKVLDVLGSLLDSPIAVDSTAPAEKTLSSHLQARFGEYGANEDAIWEALAFLAPEQLKIPSGDEIRSDIYAMGCLLFYLLTGEHLYPGNNPVEMLARKLKGQPTSLDSARPDAPRGVRELLLQTIASDPASRFPSITLLLRTLERERDTVAAGGRPTATNNEPPRGSMSGRLAPVEQMKKQLEELGLVRPMEWEKGVAKTDGSNDPARILGELMSIRSMHTWRAEGGSPPILTKYQADLILAGQAARLRFRDYIVRDRLGENGPLSIYKALNLRLERLDVLHAFPKVHGRSREDLNERVAALKEIDHPNIARIYDQFREDPFDIVVAEFVEGQDLRTHLEENYQSCGRTLPWRVGLNWCLQIASLLEKCHDANILHGNLKPSKIMITYAGKVKVLDMGFDQIYRFASGQAFATTPAVTPPEQWLDPADVSVASDIYNFGCTLYYILTGTLPFRAKSLSELRKAHMQSPPPKVSIIRPDGSEKIDAMVARLLAKNPGERYSSARQVTGELQEILGVLSPENTPTITAAKPIAEIHEPAPASASDDDPSALISLGVAVVAIAAVIVAIFYFLQ